VISGFMQPWFLALLVPLALCVAWWVRRERRGHTGAAIPFSDLDLVAAAAPGRRWTRWAPGALVALALAGFVVALARPEAITSVPREEGTIMLAIDVSGSMAADDVSPYRLRAAQDAATTFAERVPRQFQVGLIAFNGQADVLLPPSTDRQAFARAVDSLVADGATASGEAILASLDAIRSTQPGARELRSARILLLSDGANTVGTLPEDAARDAKEAGVPVYTVALGTPEGVLPDGRAVPPDPASLAAVAEITGGEAFESKDAASVRAVYEDLGTFIGTRQIVGEVTSWPTGIAALLLVLAGVAAYRVAPRL
jgi:Ca-activated chloride channel homolog